MRDAEKSLERLAEGLEQALGANLRSLLLYGSTARRTAAAGRSGLDVLCIVGDASAAALRVATPVLAAWARGGNPPPLVFAEAEWRAGADVFPLEVEDMREAHRLLRGADPFAGLLTRPADQRTELEREVRGLVLHLRSAHAAAAADGKALTAVLASSAGTLLIMLRGALRLAGRPVPNDGAAVVRDAAALAGFDATGVERALACRAGTTTLAAHDPAAEVYVDAAAVLAAWVNGFSAA